MPMIHSEVILVSADNQTISYQASSNQRQKVFFFLPIPYVCAYNMMLPNSMKRPLEAENIETKNAAMKTAQTTEEEMGKVMKIGELALATVLQSVAIRRSTGNDVSGHYFR